MSTLADSRALRLMSVTALYVAQGLPMGFVAVGYRVLLADAGYSNAAIGAAMSLAYLPWAFKLVWGPLLDAVPPLRAGRRRPFIVGAQACMGCLLLAMVWIDPRQAIGLTAAVLMATSTFASLQDVAVDALAVDILREHERGKANSLMWAGKVGGNAMGGAGGMLIVAHAGWGALFAAMAGAIWVLMLVPLCIRERPPTSDDRPASLGLFRLAWFLIPLVVVAGAMYALSAIESRNTGTWVKAIPIVRPFVAVAGAVAVWPLIDRKGFLALRDSFSFAAPWWGVVIAVMTPAGYTLVGSSLTRLLRVDLGLDEHALATLTGVVDPISGVIGALIGGALADRFGVRRVVALTMLVLGAILATWASFPGMWSSWVFVVCWSAVFAGTVAAYSAAFLGLCMALTNPRISATQFAAYMAASNLTYAWTAPVGGLLADWGGYTTLFAVAACVQVAAIALVPLVHITAANKRYAERED